VLRPERLLLAALSSSPVGEGGGVFSISLLLPSSHSGRLLLFLEKAMVVLEGFFFDGDEDLTLGLFFLVELVVGVASLRAAAESSAALTESAGRDSPPSILVSGPLSPSAPPESPFLAFLLEILIRFGLGGFT